ncbi:MAG: hypothetical protein JXB32_24090 [Deltaproteobacteria bacterium]|nr:hypothetical protein [Deltaproteobacteria bacterium]
MDRSPGVRRRLAFVAAALAAAAGACGPEEEGPGVRLILETEVGVPTVVDTVDVEVTASRTASGETCTPQVQAFPLAAPSDLPVRILYEAGPEFRSWVAFRVCWRKSGAEVRAQTVLQPVPSSGIQEVRVELAGACLTRTCGAGEQCVAGACTPVPSPDPFDPALRVPGIDCDVPR